MILLALVHAELGAMYPVAGGSARFPHYAFGSLAGFAGGWFAFLGAVTTAPIEVEAALQYSTNYVSGLTKVSGGTAVLTAQGYAVATVLMLLFSVINVMGVRWLAETNKVDRVVEDRDPGPDGHRRSSRPRSTRTTSRRGGGFMPFGLEGRLHRDRLGRRDLRLPRLRAGDPARRREPEPAAATSRLR